MSLVQAAIELLRGHWPLAAALEQVASAQPLPGQGDTPPQFVAERTLEDWYYAFKHGGFEALKPKLRSDRGKPRRLSPKQRSGVPDQVRCLPGVPVKLLYSVAAFSVSLCFTIFPILASAAAQQTGLPVCVLVIEPGLNGVGTTPPIAKRVDFHLDKRLTLPIES